ncbi:hypothetical protein D3C85_1061620 [compost metagenome]
MLVVVLLGMPFAHAPQLAASVVMVHFRQLPAVFIEVHVACRVDVTFARLDLGHHFPDAVQFVAGQVLIDMTGLEDVGVLEVG